MGTYVGITAQAANATTYTLADDAGGRFAIDPGSGEVTVADGTLLDYEMDTSHTIVIRASNADDSRVEPFAIMVIDVNEHSVSGIIDSDLAANELPESAPASSYTGITLSAEDADRDDTVAYRLLDSDGGLFAVDGENGIVTLRGSLDYERSTRHAIIAQARSSDGSMSTDLFTIDVTDENEPVGPVTDADDAADAIPERARAGAYVGITAFAEDPDAGSAVTYSLNPVLDHSLFAVDESRGGVTLASDAYRPDRAYAIEVRAMSDDGSSSARRFTVASPASKEATTATVALADDSLAEGDTTILTARLGDFLTAAATLTLSYDNNLITLGDTEPHLRPRRDRNHNHRRRQKQQSGQRQHPHRHHHRHRERQHKLRDSGQP